MRRWIGALVVVVTACASSTPSPPGLRESLGDIPDEVNASLAELRDSLGQSYESLAELYLALSDMRLGPELAVLYDKAGRIEVEGRDADLAAYEEFVGEVLLATEALDAAVAAQDLAALSLSWLRIEVAAGVMAARVEPDACRLLAPPLTSDLCLDDDAAGYEIDLGLLINRFLSRYRPAVRLPEAFGDTIRSQLVATLAPEVLAIIESARRDLDAIEIPNPYVGIHRAVGEHFDALHGVWSSVGSPDQTDPFLWGFLVTDLNTITCDAIEPYEDGRALMLAAVPDSTLVAVMETWLLGPATGCID